MNNVHPPSPHAGELQLEVDHHAEVTFRYGTISQGPRKGEKVKFTLKISEGFEGVKAKIRNFQQSTKFASEELVDDGIYFKRAKSSIQSQFVHLIQLRRI